MKCSIQEYLKKINSGLILLNCLSVLITTVFLGTFLIFLYKQKKISNIPVSYLEYKDQEIDSGEASSVADSRPFASIYGKTYTFSWCRGSQLIAVKNRIYFITELEAENTGRTLSKLCKK